MFSIVFLFEISYPFDASNVNFPFFAELGRLYRYESSCASLRNLR